MDRFAAPLPEHQTREILARIRAGDAAAWDELYRRYHDDLLFVARANLGQKLRGFLESEDVLQSVALEALKELPKFTPERQGSVRALLHRMVVRKIQDRADSVSAKKRAGGVPLTDSVERSLATPAEPAYFDHERYERLERGLAVLPDDMRRVLLLRKVEGLSSKEAAEVMGKSDAATRQLYGRALARLSTWFAESPP